MSKRTVRNIMTGTALVMTLTVGLPAVTEAAGFGSALRDGNVLELVLHWFSGFWSSAASRATTTTTTTTGPSTTAACGGDQGVCIDPNGTPH
jgi:hypothetical protein